MKITINNKEITLKYTLRSMLMYENITNGTFEPKGISDVMTFMYCIVIASSKDYSLKFDDFIDYLDENPGMIQEFSEWLQNEIAVSAQFKKN